MYNARPDIQKIITPEFLQIDRLLKRFNVFDATDMRRREVKHTKFLAHLLSPSESHGLGIKFLENLILNLNNATDTNKIDFINLDLMHAEIYSEKCLSDKNLAEKNRKQIDLLILLPSLFPGSKDTLIAIEVKVDSTESDDQLSTYRDLIEKEYSDHFQRHYYFLTVNGDDPSDGYWTGVTFGNIVIPAIEILKTHYKDMISDYLLSIVGDYIEVLDENHVREGEIDRLAQKIDKNVLAIIKNLNPSAPMKSAERVIQAKFSAAIGYLKKFDGDARRRIPIAFESIFKDPNDLNIAFKHETSSRQYLRLSFLCPDNEDFLYKICSNARPAWLKSGRNLAFEFVLKESASKSGINIQLKLVLGPTNDDFPHRQELARCISQAARLVLTSRLPLNTAKQVAPKYETLFGARDMPRFSAKDIPEVAVIEFISDCLKDEILINIADSVDEAITGFRRNTFGDS
jgi:hypothetical protein